MFVRAIRRYSTATTASTGPAPSRSGSGRSAVLGFVAGASLVGFAAYTNLVEEYRVASGSVLKALDHLTLSVAKLEEKAKKVDQLEKDIKGLATQKAHRKDLEDVRNELLKVTDEITVAHLELKSNVWELAQEVKRK